MKNLKQIKKKQNDEDAPFDIKGWLIRQTKKEKRKKSSFNIAMKKAKNEDKRAINYLKKRYNILGLWNGERIVSL